MSNSYFLMHWFPMSPSSIRHTKGYPTGHTNLSVSGLLYVLLSIHPLVLSFCSLPFITQFFKTRKEQELRETRKHCFESEIKITLKRDASHVANKHNTCTQINRRITQTMNRMTCRKRPVSPLLPVKYQTVCQRSDPSTVKPEVEHQPFLVSVDFEVWGDTHG